MAGGAGQSQTPMGGGSSPLNTGGGMSGGFGGGQQTSSPTNFGPMVNYGQGNGGGFGGQQPDNFSLAHGPNTFNEQQTVGHFGDMQYRPQPMQNPFQPQQPSFMQDPEFQGYQTQMQDLNRQMNEYMQKAPMYQQMQDLQGKMAPFQQRYQQQQDMQRMQQQRQAMQQRQFQQPSPFRRGQFQQPMGLQALMGQMRGRPVPQPRMAMDMPQTYQPMEALPTSFPQNFGREQRYSVPAYSANYSGVRAAPAPAPAPAPAAQAAPAEGFDPFYNSNVSSGF